MKDLYVIATNFQQFHQWRMSVGREVRNIRYIRSTEQVLGIEISLDQLIVLGLNPDVDMSIVQSRIRKPCAAQPRKRSSGTNKIAAVPTTFPLY